MSIETDRIRFIETGYSCIPLRPNSKAPFACSWQKTPTLFQWRDAPDNSNLGLRAGNGKAFIDCDDKNQPGTFENVINWLSSLGYDREQLPIVQTASGVGRHVFLNFAGSLLGSKRNMTTSMGAGDFRYNYGAYALIEIRNVAQLDEFVPVVSGELDAAQPGRLVKTR